VTRLSRYIVLEVVSIFIPTLLAFILLYLVVDFFDRLDILLEHDATLLASAKYFLFKVPLMVTQVLPPAVLLATLLGLGLLGRRNEIIALRAAGVSLFQMASPLLLAVAGLSVFAFAWDEVVVPYASQQFQYVNNVEIRKRNLRGIFSEREIWYRGAQGIYNIDHIDHRRGILFGVTVYHIGADFEVDSIVEIPTAIWSHDGWEIRDAVKHIEGPTGDLETLPLPATDVLIEENLDDFKRVHRRPEELSYLALRSRVQRLASQGIDATEYLVDLQMKLAVPFASLVLACVGITLAGRVRRHVSVAAIVGVGLCLGAGYWVILAFAKSLGDTAIISAVPAAWAANMIYTTIGGALFLTRE
jgi:lipopolysaccharide export system permease protein